MFHPDYRRLVEVMEHSPTFQTEYEYYPGSGLRTVLGVAIRRGSDHYDELMRIMNEERDE